MAALAYGTETVPRVDKIVGPGNIFVATAKRKVYGQVDVDMIAGPSEILVLADGTCNPAWVAADLLSQAEHDKLASAVLVTDSRELALAVQAELEVQIPQLPRAEIARTSIDTNGKIIVTDDMHKAVAAANLIAPEHLEVCVDDPFSLLNEIRNAGSIFWVKRARGPGRLLCRPEPHAAHQRHGPLLQPAVGGRLCEEVQLPVLHPGGSGQGAGPHRRLCRAGRACTAMPAA